MISKGNNVKFAHFVLLAVSEEAKTWLAGLLRWPSRSSKKTVEDKDTQNTKRSMKVAKELFADYVKEKNWGKERVDTNFENIHYMSQRERKNSFNV